MGINRVQRLVRDVVSTYDNVEEPVDVSSYVPFNDSFSSSVAQYDGSTITLGGITELPPQLVYKKHLKKLLEDTRGYGNQVDFESKDPLSVKRAARYINKLEAKVKRAFFSQESHWFLTQMQMMVLRDNPEKNIGIPWYVTGTYTEPALTLRYRKGTEKLGLFQIRGSKDYQGLADRLVKEHELDGAVAFLMPDEHMKAIEFDANLPNFTGKGFPITAQQLKIVQGVIGRPLYIADIPAQSVESGFMKLISHIQAYAKLIDPRALPTLLDEVAHTVLNYQPRARIDDDLIKEHMEALIDGEDDTFLIRYCTGFDPDGKIRIERRGTDSIEEIVKSRDVATLAIMHEQSVKKRLSQQPEGTSLSYSTLDITPSGLPSSSQTNHVIITDEDSNAILLTRKEQDGEPAALVSLKINVDNPALVDVQSQLYSELIL